MTPEEEADLRREVERLRDALRLAEADGESARRDLTAAYGVLYAVVHGRPATVTAAAEKAAKLIRDHAAERGRVLAERDRLADEKAKLSATIAAFPDANNAANIAHARMQRDRLAEQVTRLAEDLEATMREWSDSEPPGANVCDAVDEHNCHLVAGEAAFKEAIRQARALGGTEAGS